MPCVIIGREGAGQKSAILYTIVENCRRLGINTRFLEIGNVLSLGQISSSCVLGLVVLGLRHRLAREYLEDVLTRLPAMNANEVASLIPANWLKARGGKAARKIA